jgi:dienelactone hydrolase
LARRNFPYLRGRDRQRNPDLAELATLKLAPWHSIEVMAEGSAASIGGSSGRCRTPAGDIKGELLTVWGRQDPHVPLNGRNLIRARLEEVGANFQWHEVNGQHAFLRDEGPRYDPALAYHCYGLVFELFHRRLGSGDLAD